MPPFRHIRLNQHKGLKGATLFELKKINVICGPNNSGKTTVLECIASKNLCLSAIEISDSLAQSIARNGLHGVGWGNNDNCNRVYVQSVTKALNDHPVMFIDEIQTFIKTIDWNFTGNWSNPTGSLLPVLTNAFPPPPSVILLPAKRRLETSKHADAFEQIWSDGTGVLNSLFKAKNQNESTTERKNFDRIASAFKDISSGYEFDVFIQTKDLRVSPPPTNVELHFRRKGGSWIQAADCGLGLQELLLLLYFALATEHEVVLIEEPENHLHPEIQRRLIGFLREKTEKQFFLSTHSSVFLNTLFADRVFTCRMMDGVQVENATSRAALLTELGYSIADNLISGLVVLCEGPKDKPVLEEFLQKMGALDKSNIKIWPLGGDIMDQLDLSVFQETHQLIAVIDNDPGSANVRKRFLKKCEDLKIPVTKLERYAIENYFLLEAIAAGMNVKIPTGVVTLDPMKRVSDQLGFEVKGNGGKIAREMKLEDVKGSDLGGFLEQVAVLAAKEKKPANPA
jgi:energy-coupling factor transporter ATP-binding protein EcfA2